ncbi:MAG TPA: universal stress protein [Candidatus Lokiarchaeia archaeon]|nr:universal stress protein [Candidatus Lokiarchaeia archaeon]
MYKKVLLALDGSDNSKRAVEKVIEVAKTGNVEDVVAFHSVKHRYIPAEIQEENLVPDAAWAHFVEAIQNAGATILEEAEASFVAAGLQVETRLVTDLSPEEYIINAVEEEGFDLVVLGCRGDHSRLRVLFLGSVANRVVNSAPCDVLIVR